jgi:RNA polymerase sigma-70 factor (ECF subfamily)
MSDGESQVSKADHEHMARLAEGSQTAWGKLYDRHYEAVRRFCGNFTNAPETAEEWTQDTFLKLKQRADTFRAGSELKPWLYKVARNICLEALRRRREINWSDSIFASRIRSAVDSGPSPASKVASSELSDKAKDILGALREEQRTAFLLKYAEDLSLQEVALAMDTPEATVKTWLYRTMLALRRELGEQSESVFGPRS